MKFLKANGLVTHTLDQGRRDAPPLVFINSLGTDFRIWNEVADILVADFRIVTYDKRGHGLSESGPDKNDIADYARDLAALLDILGVGRATIVGLSIGGLIAQELYRQNPERVAALVLCDTAPAPSMISKREPGMSGHLPNVEKPKIVADLVAEHARKTAS